ncbi:hypothetical protein [Novosphingobium sp. 63-713]|nr:hypothetical protein [Novosphingobium sp. 63-713]
MEFVTQELIYASCKSRLTADFADAFGIATADIEVDNYPTWTALVAATA